MVSVTNLFTGRAILKLRTGNSRMSISLHYAEISEPHLLDVVDDEWARDKMPNDGESHVAV